MNIRSRKTEDKKGGKLHSCREIKDNRESGEFGWVRPPCLRPEHAEKNPDYIPAEAESEPAAAHPHEAPTRGLTT